MGDAWAHGGALAALAALAVACATGALCNCIIRLATCHTVGSASCNDRAHCRRAAQSRPCRDSITSETANAPTTSHPTTVQLCAAQHIRRSSLRTFAVDLMQLK